MELIDEQQAEEMVGELPDLDIELNPLAQEPLAAEEVARVPAPIVMDVEQPMPQ